MKNALTWINTHVEFAWDDDKQQYVEVRSEGYWYAGKLALAHNTPLIDQDSYAFYEDGSESGSTIIGTANNSQTLTADTIYQCRILLQEYNGGSSNNYSGQFEYQINGGGWNNVTTAAAPIQAVNSTNLTDAAATTQRLGAGTYITANDGVTEDGLVDGTADFSGNDEVEYLLSFQIPSGQVSNGDTIEIRINGVDQVTNTATLTAQVNVPVTINGTVQNLTLTEKPGQFGLREHIGARPEELNAGALYLWQYSQVTIEPNDIANPLITTHVNADKVVASNINGVHYLNQNTLGVSFRPSGMYAASFYFRPDEMNDFSFRINHFTSGNEVVFNVLDNAVNGHTGPANRVVHSYDIESVANGWYRFKAVFQFDSTDDSFGEIRYRVYLHSGTSDTFTGNNVDGMHFWGFQVEQAAVINDYRTVDNEIAPSLIALTLTEQPATVDYTTSGTFINAGVDALALTEQAADINAAINITTNTPDALVITEQAADINAATNITTNAPDALIVTEYPASLAVNVNTNAPDALIVTTYVADVSQDSDTLIDATVQNMVLTEQVASVNAATNITTGSPDALLIAEQAANVNAAIQIDGTLDALVLTEFPATVALIEPVVLSDSANIAASGENTTAQLTAPAGKTTADFDAGRIQDDENPADAVDITADDYSEFEWNIQIQSPAVATDVYEFRVTKNGTPLDTYTVTPQLTVSSGATNINAGVDALVLTEYPAAINAATNITTVLDPLVVASYAAEINAATNITTNLDALTLATLQAGLSRNVDATVDALTLTTYQATVSQGTEINAGLDVLGLTNQPADINAAKNITTVTDALVQTALAASVVFTFNISATTDALALTTQPADIKFDTQIQTNVDALALTTYPASLDESTNVFAGVDALVLTEYAANINFALDIPTNLDALVITELPADINAATNITATLDALAVTNYPFGLSFNIDAGVDVLTLTEQPADINAAKNITTNLDALVVTEYPATVTTDDNVVVNAGTDALVLTEFPADINATLVIDATLDALALTEHPASVNLGKTIDATVDSLISTVYPAAVTFDVGITTTVDALTLTTYQANIGQGQEVDANFDALVLTEYPASIEYVGSVNAGVHVLTLTEHTASVSIGGYAVWKIIDVPRETRVKTPDAETRVINVSENRTIIVTKD